MAVVQAIVAQVFYVFAHVTQVADAHQVAIVLLDHQRAVVRRVVELVIGGNHIALCADINRAFGQVDVRCGDHLAHLFKAHAVMVEAVRVEFDPHRRQGPAAHRHIAHATGLQELLFEQG